MNKQHWLVIIGAILILMALDGNYLAQSSAPVSRIAFSPQSGILALGFIDTLELRNQRNNTLLTTVYSPLPSEYVQQNDNFRITELAFNPTGTTLAVSYSGHDTPNYILVINAFTGEILHTLIEGDGIFDLAWHPSGNQFVAKVRYGSGGMVLGQLLTWDTTTGNLLNSVDMGFNTTIIGVDWDSSGNRILSADVDNVATIWDTATWTRTSLSLQADSCLVDVAWSSDDTQVIGLDDQRTLYIWNSSTGALLHKLQNGLTEGEYNLSISPNDRIAINGGLDVIVWDINGQEPISQIIPVTSPASDTVWLNDVELLYTHANTYEVINTSAVQNFTLGDPASNPIAGFDPLANNTSIDLATVTASPLTFQATTNPATVGSVMFNLNGLEQIDDTAPYELEWTPTLGAYTLTATPYSGAGGTGTAGTALSINFTVTDTSQQIDPP